LGLVEKMCNLHRLAFCSIAFVAILSIFDVVQAGAVQSNLDLRVERFDCEQSSSLDQLITLGKQFHVPLGIEWRHRADEKAAVPVHLHDVSFRQALDQILMQQAGYDFEETQGLVHVYDRSLAYDDANYLNIKLPQVRVDNQNIFGVTFWLRVAIKGYLHPTPGGMGGGHGYGPGREDGFDTLKVTIDRRDVSVREVLNEAVAKQGNAMWVVILHPSERMAHERFYAQGYWTNRGAVADDFTWQFVALNDHLKQ
jgi:hypothetical protein